MIEDVLQASLPGVVSAVRIADVGEGTNPLRIVSMRALPDQPGHPDYPREEWVGLDKDAASKQQSVEAEQGTSSDLDTDQTLTPESSLPETSAAPSCVNRRTFTER